MLTVDDLRKTLATRTTGMLRAGSHPKPLLAVPDCCIMELISLARGEDWTDEPEDTEDIGSPVRALNDSDWSTDAMRTLHVLPLGVLTDSTCRPGWAYRYVLATAREIMPRIAPDLPWYEVQRPTDVPRLLEDSTTDSPDFDRVATLLQVAVDRVHSTKAHRIGADYAALVARDIGGDDVLTLSCRLLLDATR